MSGVEWSFWALISAPAGILAGQVHLWNRLRRVGGGVRTTIAAVTDNWSTWISIAGLDAGGALFLAGVAILIDPGEPTWFVEGVANGGVRGWFFLGLGGPLLSHVVVFGNLLRSRLNDSDLDSISPPVGQEFSIKLREELIVGLVESQWEKFRSNVRPRMRSFKDRIDCYEVDDEEYFQSTVSDFFKSVQRKPSREIDRKLVKIEEADLDDRRDQLARALMHEARKAGHWALLESLLPPTAEDGD